MTWNSVNELWHTLLEEVLESVTNSIINQRVQIEMLSRQLPNTYYVLFQNIDTVETDLIATEMLVFSSKSSRNKNDSNPIDGKTTPIIMGIISIPNSNDSDHFSPQFSQPLRCRYQIRFYSMP